MKKIFIIAACLMFALAPGISFADDTFVIHSFASNIQIKKDGSVVISEKINLEFSAKQHGIYRDLPFKYKNEDGTIHYSDVRVLNVLMDDQTEPYEVIRNDTNLRIKIGNPHRLVSGVHTYTIIYDVTGVLLNEDKSDSLYWNVVGSGWIVPIEKVSATVSVEGTSITEVRCFNGFTGSTELCSATINKEISHYTSARSLAPGEALTIIARYPSGVIPVVTIAAPKTEDDWGLTMVCITAVVVLLICIIAILWVWWRKGRDYVYQRKSLHDPDQTTITRPLFGFYEPIVPEYDPPAKLRPGEIGVLLDEKVNDEDISATIVDLAIRGYLIIEEIETEKLFPEKDYILRRTSKSADDLLEYETTLLAALFKKKQEVTISSLKYTLTASLAKVREQLYELVTKKGFFDKNPNKVRNRYLKVGGFMAAGSILLFIIISGGLGGSTAWWYAIVLGLFVGLFASGILVGFTAFLMPRRTARGREVYRQALGYKLFVSGTEKYRQPFFEKENIFMEVLPYAIVFGVTKKLAKAMAEMQLPPTNMTWYIGGHYANMMIFADSIDSLSNSLSSAMATSPSNTSSGGGGFSGGGFGGGGGGSW